jgi:uncharacterized protein (TIGR00369 family)
VADAPPASPEPVSDEALLARFQNARRRPPSSDTLGFRMLALDQAARQVEIACEGRPEFCNAGGRIQGGFLTAMLDEAMSVSAMIASGMTAYTPTLEMKTSFLRPAQPGPLRVVGRVAKWGRQVCFLEGEIYDDKGQLLAKASATAMPQPFRKEAGREKT